LQLRRGEFLASTANPVDLEIVGIEGRAELLREMVKGLDMPPDRIVPSRQELARREQEKNQPPPQQQPPMLPPQAQQSPQGVLLPDGSPAGGQSHNQF
jgi:hypothetical protein